MWYISNIAIVEIWGDISATNKSKWQRHLDDSKSKYARDDLLCFLCMFSLRHQLLIGITCFRGISMNSGYNSIVLIFRSYFTWKCKMCDTNFGEYWCQIRRIWINFRGILLKFRGLWKYFEMYEAPLWSKGASKM